MTIDFKALEMNACTLDENHNGPCVRSDGTVLVDTEAYCNHDNQPTSRTYCECGARFYDRTLQRESRVSGTPFIVYRQEIRQSRPVFVSMHATRLGAVRAYKRMEREFGRQGYYPASYGWEDAASVFGANL